MTMQEPAPQGDQQNSTPKPRRIFFRRRRPFGQRPQNQPESAQGASATPATTEEHITTRDEINEKHVPVPHDFLGHNKSRPVVRNSFKEYVNKKQKKPYILKRENPVKVQFDLHREDMPLRIIPIGGLEEVGGNSMVVEYANDMIVIDCGVLFGGHSLPGVDYVAPDLAYVQQMRNRFRGFVITHGHLDHIGALPHILPKFDFPPVYAPRLAMGLIKKQLEEAGLYEMAKPNLHEYVEGDVLRFGQITIDPFRVDHSLPDCYGLYIQTPGGTAVHTGDFRIDPSSLDEKKADLDKIAAIGNRGVDVLMADSTNATVEGNVPPEKEVIENLEKVISQAEGRVIIATFSTLLTRIQQIIQIGKKYNRKVYLNGRSMLNNATLARELGFIKFETGDVKKVTQKINSVPDNQVIILTTGSQGEPLAGLTRMAVGAHPVLAVKKGDLVIHSARIIPEHTEQVLTVINTLIRKGAKVMFRQNTKTMLHTSGHAFRGDLRIMMDLIKPRHVMPLHGELFMRDSHRELAIEHGIPPERAHLIENGDALEVYKGEVKIFRDALMLNDIIVEKGNEGDMKDPVISERHTMKENGVFIATLKIDKATRQLKSNPRIITRGFAFKSVSQIWTRDLSQATRKIYEKVLAKAKTQKKQKDLIHILRAVLGRYLTQTYEKSPIIIPIFIEE